ncbi:MAG: fluoride efflux transporter CrcB [Burkholderiales bacterium]|nr:fluoride efflux transporter CrcB [Burkholderiales bacterium]
MSVPLTGFIAVGVGAALGAWARWGLGVAFNRAVPELPLGTLIANLVGGFLIGVAIEVFELKGHVSPETRLFVITGFLGGLTTFSAFSGEAVSLLAQGRLGWAAAHIASHLVGSIALTFVGIWAVRTVA